MKRVRRILVPVDFSGASADALRAAVRLAPRTGARIDLLHVLQVPHGPLQAFRTLRELRLEGGVTGGRPKIQTGIRIDPEKQEGTLAAWAKRVEKAGVKVSIWVAMGKPGEEIILAADQLDVDLVVMGTRGLSGLRGVLVGSTAAETVRSAAVPVLTIGAGVAFDPRRMLVADDLGAGGLAAIGAARSMFDPGSARVLLLHVIDPGALAYTGVSEWGWAPTPNVPPGDPGRAHTGLEKRAAGLRKSGFRVECLVAEGLPAATIAEIAEKWKARTLVLATHQRTALARLAVGSTAEALVRRAICPVLTVKAVPRALCVEKSRAVAATRPGIAAIPVHR